MNRVPVSRNSENEEDDDDDDERSICVDDKQDEDDFKLKAVSKNSNRGTIVDDIMKNGLGNIEEYDDAYRQALAERQAINGRGGASTVSPKVEWMQGDETSNKDAPSDSPDHMNKRMKTDNGLTIQRRQGSCKLLQ